MKPPGLCFLAHLGRLFILWGCLIFWSHLFPQSRLFPFGDPHARKHLHSRPMTTVEETPQGWASGNTRPWDLQQRRHSHTPEWLAILWTISSWVSAKFKFLMSKLFFWRWKRKFSFDMSKKKSIKSEIFIRLSLSFSPSNFMINEVLSF